MKIIINNALTGETVERDMSAEQEAQHNAAVEAANASAQVEADRRTQLAADKASAKAKLIAGEPLTEDEANTIVI